MQVGRQNRSTKHAHEHKVRATFPPVSPARHLPLAEPSTISPSAIGSLPLCVPPRDPLSRRNTNPRPLVQASCSWLRVSSRGFGGHQRFDSVAEQARSGSAKFDIGEKSERPLDRFRAPSIRELFRTPESSASASDEIARTKMCRWEPT